MELNEREIELIDGMIEVQKNHASRCDTIANRTIAEKQKVWDMERVALLEKIKTTRATDPLLEEMARALEELDDMFDPTSGVGEIINKALQKYNEQRGKL